MKVEKGPLEGLLIIEPEVFEDSRGFFFESFNADRFREHGVDLDWTQDNHVRSCKNTVRGLHFQRGGGQDKLIRCVRGRVWDVAVDIRPDSPTLGQWFGIELTEQNMKMFLAPAGFAHGYAVLSGVAECLYKCSKVYDGELEDGFRWNDPEVGVEWPVTDPVLSERDLSSPSFKECMKSLASA